MFEPFRSLICEGPVLLLRISFLGPGFQAAEEPGKVGVQLLRISFLGPGFQAAEEPGKVGVQTW
jgi:hypothetical protein